MIDRISAPGFVLLGYLIWTPPDDQEAICIVVRKLAAALYPALFASGPVTQASWLAPMSFASKRLISKAD